MSTNILLIGQCTLHMGRMEHGNIGNYYIIEPFIRELHSLFKNAEIRTTFQMSNKFCKNENIICLPADLYYSWDDKDSLKNSMYELGLSEVYKHSGSKLGFTDYMNNVVWADLVIDFSGDIWGENANLVGEDRFLVGLLKDRVAQNLGAKTAMLAGSPGPFDNYIEFAKEVYKGFDLVTNREPVSTELLEREGFDLDNTLDLACPSFLFEACSEERSKSILSDAGLDGVENLVGFILCDWNMPKGPYTRRPREDFEFEQFVDLVGFMVEDLDMNVVFISHSNGFEVNGDTFEEVHGRDFYISSRMFEILNKNDKIKKHVFLLDGVYSPSETKGILSNFGMVVSGRLHGAVAGISQNIPTVILDYGHGPKAHKLKGFSKILDVEEYIADPADLSDMIDKTRQCWERQEDIVNKLSAININVKKMAKDNFYKLKDISGPE